MGYWCAARLKPGREHLALTCLALAGFATYFPRVREQRIRQGRRVEVTPPLFPGYAFVEIELQWTRAHYAPGVIRLVLNGEGPARVPDAAIAELKARERNGLVVLPEKLKRGDAVRILRGPFREHLALFEGQTSRERVAVLLSLFAGARRVELPEADVEAVC